MADTGSEQLNTQDVAWRLVGHSALDIGQGGTSSGLTSSGKVVPSVAVFYCPVPRQETAGAFPMHRIVMLKVAVTTAGLQWMNQVQPNPHLPPIPIYTSVPCIGGVIGLRLSYTTPAGERQWPNVAPTELTQQGLYIRDIYPKHQEMIVNQQLGQETLQTSSRRVATTEGWNASVSASVSLFDLVNLGGSYGTSSSTTTETTTTESKRETRVVEVQNINHVLTAYHLGSPEMAFTIQPRPFEGESWELINGYRVLEGIQEFILIVNMPHRAKYLRVDAQFLVGFRGIQDTRDLNIRQSVFYSDLLIPLLIGRADNASSNIDMEGYQKWITKYIEIKTFNDRLRWDALVGTTRLDLNGWGRTFYGNDPCAPESNVDPCLAVSGAGTRAQLNDVFAPEGQELSAFQKQSKFSELPVRYTPPLEGSDRRSIANANMRNAFEAVLLASRQANIPQVELQETSMFQTSFLRALANLPSSDTRSNISLDTYMSNLNARQIGHAQRFNLQTLRDLTHAPQNINTSTDAKTFLELRDAILSGILGSSRQSPQMRRKRVSAQSINRRRKLKSSKA